MVHYFKIRYYIDNCQNWGRISVRCWIHKRHPIARPNGRSMGCLWILWENWPHYNGTALYFVCFAFYSNWFAHNEFNIFCLFVYQEEEEEGGDRFSIEITVTDPKKMGDGMNAYMAFKVNTKVSGLWGLHRRNLLTWLVIIISPWTKWPPFCR